MSSILTSSTIAPGETPEAAAPDNGGQARPDRLARERREAEALRENLRRRKAQARARSAEAAAPAPSPPDVAGGEPRG